MTFKVPERLYRTVTGRLVRHNDPEASFLAFPAGHELSDEEAARHGVTAFYAPAPAVSVVNGSTAKPLGEEKMAARPRDKAALTKETK